MPSPSGRTHGDSVTWDGPPRLCCSVGTSLAHVRDALRALDAGTEMCEIRVDLLADAAEREDAPSLFALARELGVSTIATVRELPKDGDDAGFSAARLRLVERCVDAGASMVDLEVEAPDAYAARVVAKARERGCAVVVSYHAYEQTEASSMGLARKVDECFAKGADVAKVAVAVVSRRGAGRVLALYDDDRRVVALGMGRHGVATRVAACMLGAPFTFVAWDERSATAPGQLSRDAMRRVVDLLPKDAVVVAGAGSGAREEQERKRAKA